MDVLMPRSSVPGLAWPGLPGTAGVAMLALQYQLEQSQWWPPDVVRQQQVRQLQALPSHACGTVPFYRDRLGEAGFAPDRRLTADTWARIPVLGRAEIRRRRRRCSAPECGPDEIEVTLVVEKTLSGEQEGRLREALNRHLGHPFAYRFTYVDEIPRSAGGKFEDFRVEPES